MPSPKKSVSISRSSAKKKPLSVPRPSKPSASLTLPSFGRFSFSISLDASIMDGKVTKIDFSSRGPEPFHRIVAKGCAFFRGKTLSQIEQVTLPVFLEEIDPSPEEKPFAEYALSALQDVVSRLPFDDPLSKALTRLHVLNREFKYGTLLPDLED